MRTVKNLKQELEKLPDDFLVYAYEGEVIGLIIQTDSGDQVGYITAGESSTPETKPIILF